MNLDIPQCSICIHFDPSRRDITACAAFPDGIPGDIILNEIDHRDPVEGDHGVRFEPEEGAQSPFEEPEPTLMA
jgi:hypothetical protein